MDMDYEKLKFKLETKWDIILSVYPDLNWQGKYVNRKKMIKIKRIIDEINKILNGETKSE